MKPVDRYFFIGSRHSRLSEPVRMWSTEQWEERVKREYYCPGREVKGNGCSYGRPEFKEAPLPLEPEVYGDERGFTSSTWPLAIHLFRDDAREFFAPYLPAGVAWGRVYRLEETGRVPTRFSTCLVPHSETVEMDRGTTPIAPKYCPICDRAYCWAGDCRHMGILRWQIRDRPVLINDGCYMCVHPEFYHDMKLKERFPDIKIVHKIKIYDKDPHGWVLPGDPEWDGVFRKPAGWVDPVPAE